MNNLHDQPQEPAALPAPGQNNYWFYYSEEDTVLIFVHGVLSDSRNCWLRQARSDRERSIYWPSLVHSDPRLSHLCIYLGGYYTDIDSGPYEISHCAYEMFSAMARPDVDGRPPVLDKPRLIFICHSTGGIVVRYLLCKHFQDFSSKQVGLVMIASPSYGSSSANRLALLSTVYNHSVGKQLQWGSWSLAELDKNFKDLLYSRRIPNLTGVEACENHFIVHRKWLPSKRLVVTEASAGKYFGAPVMLRKTDHFSCVKPDGVSHPAHQLLVDFVLRSFQRRGLNSSDNLSGKASACVEEKLRYLGGLTLSGKASAWLKETPMHLAGLTIDAGLPRNHREGLKTLIDRVKLKLQEMRYMTADIEKVAVIIYELVLNAFEHGCKKQDDTVKARVRVWHELVTVQVENVGVKFKFSEELERARKRLNDFPESVRGRGLILINAIASEVKQGQHEIHATLVPGRRPDAPVSSFLVAAWLGLQESMDSTDLISALAARIVRVGYSPGDHVLIETEGHGPSKAIGALVLLGLDVNYSGGRMLVVSSDDAVLDKLRLLRAVKFMRLFLSRAEAIEWLRNEIGVEPTVKQA